MLQRGEFQARSTELGERLHARLRALIGHGVVAVRGMGLWAGVDIDPALATGKQISMKLAERGVLVKDTQGSTLRFAPPLVITAEEIDWAIGQFADVIGRSPFTLIRYGDLAPQPVGGVSTVCAEISVSMPARRRTGRVADRGAHAPWHERRGDA